jgi:multidrug efflux pump
MGVGLDAVRAAVSAQNVNQAKGSLQSSEKSWMIRTNDQLKKAKDYRPIIVAYRNGAPVRLSDVADVEDSYTDTHVAGRFNGKPCVMIIIFRQPGISSYRGPCHRAAAVPQGVDAAGQSLDIAQSTAR